MEEPDGLGEPVGEILSRGPSHVHGEIGENAIFTMDKREFPRGFLLLSI